MSVGVDRYRRSLRRPQPPARATTRARLPAWS